MSFLQTNFLALSPKTREALSFDLYKQNELKSTHSTVLQETLKEKKLNQLHMAIGCWSCPEAKPRLSLP